ncbi:hypothetical protein [Thalassorhabdomicrobium marinisediminis]|uniref:hypothetical protein n=1 Tax=Thalassorhabdomicrobium marinisediminis TaxID=2170577 RepID=UPI0024912CC7|nr:hypothetical protein [Thalassorhabdomicrobium marinisediminis]
MAHVVQTDQLVSEGILTADQGAIIASRSRRVMVSLAINTVLSIGIIAAAAGFIALLADAFSVALLGAVFLALGAAILTRADALYRMFGLAAALIGAGMLAGGSSIEVIDTFGEDAGGLALAALGLAASGSAAGLHRKATARTGFLSGSLLILAVGMHLLGLYTWAAAAEIDGVPAALVHLWAAMMLFAAGVVIDVRLVTALAIVPFAQILDTGTFYAFAMYAFYSPESTLTIVQMALAMAVCVAVAGQLADRYRRHTHLFGIMAFVVANLCFLVGSLWGDVVGSHLWGPGHYRYEGDYEAYTEAVRAFEARTLVISDHVYSIVWAVLLIAAAVWAANTHRRGIFNAAMTFAAIHGYTQVFETFYDEPLAYVIGGLAAIPLAWGLWRLNDRFESLASAP